MAVVCNANASDPLAGSDKQKEPSYTRKTCKRCCSVSVVASNMLPRETYRVGCETGQESCLDIIVSVQPKGGVDQGVVNVAHDRNRGIDLCEFCTA